VQVRRRHRAQPVGGRHERRQLGRERGVERDACEQAQARRRRRRGGRLGRRHRGRGYRHEALRAVRYPPPAMIKVLVAALTGLAAGIAVMVVVIALSGTDTPGAADIAGQETVTIPGGETGDTVNTQGPGGTSPTDGGTTGGGITGGGTTGGGGGSGDAANGETLFSEQCATCHAIEAGESSQFPSAPNLAESSLSEEEILQQIETGGNGMPPDLVQGQDAVDVATYVLQAQG
jgi:cytochrome c551